MNTALPGITLRLLGKTSIWPAAPSAWGWRAQAMASTRSRMRAMARPAFLRIGIGVDPVWLSLPVTVIWVQLRP